MQRTVFILVLLLVVGAFGSCNDSDGDSASPVLESFTVKVGSETVEAAIDHRSRSVSLAGIPDGMLITGVSYGLSAGAAIYPAPEYWIGRWEKQMRLLLRKDGAGCLYSVVLADYIDPDEPPAAVKYAENLQYVIADIKQGFIRNSVQSEIAVANYLKGFRAMKVNGVRVPIFPKGYEPNTRMLDYFIEEAVKAGFKVFANPAQHSGGKRIATGNFESVDGNVLDDAAATRRLIDAVKEYSMRHKFTWISPFNEDNKVGVTWSAAQIDEIYGSLHGAVNGAVLVGPCAWGIDASIDVITKTALLDYVSVSTTHNLGFDHALWPKFITLSGRLPVWDSEATDNVVDSKESRLKVAVESGVQGVVLYNAWIGIDPGSGAVSAANRAMMAIYLDE